MRLLSESSFFCLLAFLLLSSYSRLVTAQECEDERLFDYTKDGRKGPGRWGDLNPEWAACNNGTMQSPIDIPDARAQTIPNAGELKMSYKPFNATLMNRGHDISIQWWNRSAGTIQINGNAYFLEQGHWHSPSEHTINGRRYELELHMVHSSVDPNAKNKFAVVAFLYQLGPPDRFLHKLLENLRAMSREERERTIGILDPREMRMDGNDFYRYVGSLTAPPCTEGVIWNINKKTNTVSLDQVNALRLAVHEYAKENARPLQQLNQREIKFYGANQRASSLINVGAGLHPRFP